ncbi:MAG: MauE/DoxX family redox-associated membrane protein [Bacteroidia bacterium]
MNSKTTVQIGRIVISFLFIFGAISKFVSMPFFDGMVAELFLGKDYFNNPSGMYWVQWMARILVAVELALGIALLQNKWFKSIVLPATMVTLILFTIHLFYEGFRQENGFIEGNCGCFGDVLPMTNLESIFKNVIGMALGIWVWIKFNKKDHVFASWVSPVMVGLVSLFTLGFGVKSYEAAPAPTVIEELAIAPVDTLSMSVDSLPENESTSEEEIVEEPTSVKPTIEAKEPEEKPEEQAPPKVAKTASDITLELLHTYAPDIKSQDLANSTKLVCLFSMTCSHCQEVYRDISSMKSSGKLPGLYLVNYGSEYEQNYFFTQAGNENDPHTITEDFTSFKRMLEGKTYPRILYVKNGKIIEEWDVDTYKKEGFMKYFGIEKIEEKKSGGLQLELEGGSSPW